MTYAIREVFATLQGEGFHAGKTAIFVRFSGCNLWNGKNVDRERDAERNRVTCPVWCDTDFESYNLRMDAAEIVQSALAHWLDRAKTKQPSWPSLIVFTGGEPLLQLDGDLVGVFRETFPLSLLCVETNGTVAPKDWIVEHVVDWFTVSPKVPAHRMALKRGHELKVVVPELDPLTYDVDALYFEHRFVSPCARTTAVGQSEVERDAIEFAAWFCLENPHWRLTLQMHKHAGLR